MRRRLRGLLLCAAAATGCTSLGSAPDVAEPLAAAMQRAPIVLLGEVHDNAEQHRLRAEGFRRLLASGARPALLMEQFDRALQPEIERARSLPEANADSIVAAAGGAGWTWAHYRPFIELALAHGVPIVAANVSRAEAQRIARDGLAASGFAAQAPAGVEALLVQAIVDGHCGALDAGQARRLLPAQLARDQFMASLVEQHAARGVVLLAGNGHVRTDAGVPRWLQPATRARSVAIGMPELPYDDEMAFDVTLPTRPQPRDDPCAGFRRGPPPRN